MSYVRPAFLVLPLVLTIPLVGCEDTVVSRVYGKIGGPPLLDFGNVQVGIISELEIEVLNEGTVGLKVTGVELAPNFVEAGHAFTVSTQEFSIAPQGKHVVRLSFQPFVPMETPVESSITFVSDAKIDNQIQKLTVTLRGRGIETGILVEPNPVEFGAVLIGTSRTVDVKITNLLSQPIDVFSEVGTNQRAKITSSGGNGRFELKTPLRADGSVLPAGSMIAPMESYTVQVEYTPDATTAGQHDTGRWVIRNCESSLCEVEVRMNGTGTASGIECMPPAVDFGEINPGRHATRTVTCMNITTADVTVTSWGLGPSSAIEFSATPFAGMMTAPIIGAGESFNIETFFDPTEATLGRQVTATLEIATTSGGRILDPLIIPMNGVGGGPTISVVPDALEFGRIAVNTSHAKRVLVSNSGYSDLVVSMLTIGGTDALMFAVNDRMIRLGTGTSTVVTVTFTPSAAIPAVGELLIHSNDGSNPVVTVQLTGTGVDLPPCDYVVQPSSVGFGVLPLMQTAQETVRIINNGTTDCLVNDLELVGDPMFSLTNGPETNVTIAGGASKDVPIDYVPTVAGTHAADLGFYISSQTASNPTVPVFGVGLAATEITCPPPVTTPAGTPVLLSVASTTMGTNIVSWDWTIVSAPTGGIGTPMQWTPNPPRAQTVTFLPYIVGVYQIHVTVVDTANQTRSCDTEVTAEGHGLRVQLTWNGTGDVDLHLHNGNMASPWFTADDCHYGNRTPLWNATLPMATGENPELDFDNTIANGPENTRVDTVVIGQPYTIAAHNYSGAAGRVATVEIFCGGVTAATGTFTSPTLTGAGSGDCSNNHFWRVATVTFSTQQNCTITPINTVGPSVDACNNF